MQSYQEHVELKEMVGPQTETLEDLARLQQSLNREEQMSAELRMIEQR